VHSETDGSLAPFWNCRHCCDNVVVRQDGGGWKIEVADDWQHPMWGGSSSWGTGEPCLGDTGELYLASSSYQWLLPHSNKSFAAGNWPFEMEIARYSHLGYASLMMMMNCYACCTTDQSTL